ncbi:MAG: serine/threonine-protein kinase [Acidobacteria bacterium]|nr:serine/threonine-protein kinase [Acidobacteriota bacterium]
MTLEAGRDLLHYRIVDKIGEGGMGVVWRAEDTSLGREVAIKVLPPTWVGDAERLQRFEREARLLASLNHPNVATVHGLHEAETATGPVRFIAMEYVPGEDLAARLERGPLGLEQALGTARRIARGLEAAHAAGVVHRDLKPANIRMTPDGNIKVLDFGLAKGALAEISGDPELSPTLTSAGTQAGVVLGTAAYMSPEQAKGQVVDRRADVWAFGVVLYEMLTGAGAFRGDSIADTMASVLKLEPDFDKLPSDTPVGVRRVLRRCLQKNPDRRLHSIADARIEIEEAELEVPPDSERSATSGGGKPTAPLRRRAFLLLAGAGLGLVVGALIWSLLAHDAPSRNAGGSNSVRRSVIPLPVGEPLNRGNNIAISPDGSVLALNAGLDEKSHLYLRRLDSFEMEVIPGTEGAEFPFFSPDGEHLGFFAGGALKKVSLRGGGSDVTVLCDVPVAGSGAWDASGWIYFTFGESRLARVRDDGGDPQELGDAGDVYNVHPLPGGRGILLTLQSADSPSIRKDTSTIAVLGPDGKTVTPVIDGGYNARYLASGHLVFMRGGGLYAVPFDLDRLEATPPAVSVQPGVWTDSIWAIARYDASSDGTLVFVSGGDFARTVPTWVDLETGAEEPLEIPPGVYNNFDLSPDGTQLAIQNAGGSQDQVYVYDSRRGTFTRLTQGGANIYPVWSLDGREVFFASNRDGKGFRLYRQPVDGSAPASRLLTDEQEGSMETSIRYPCSVTPDGNFLMIFTWAHPTRGGDLWKVPLHESGDPEVVLATEANEIIPQVSPDGRWLAYLSNQTGPYRILVRPFPGVKLRKWVVSSGSNGFDPRWSSSGDALLYREGVGRLMRAPVGVGDEFTPGVGRVLIETDFHDAAGSSFAVSPDGRRVLLNKPVDVSFWDGAPVSLVTGWGVEVSKAVGAGVD